jgi:hypothetical protein
MLARLQANRELRKDAHMGEHFDELAKAFAQGRSRRQALQRFITGVAASALALVVPGGAAPAAGFSGSTACIKYCLQLKGRDRQFCLSQAPTCLGDCVIVQGSFICL